MKTIYGQTGCSCETAVTNEKKTEVGSNVLRKWFDIEFFFLQSNMQNQALHCLKSKTSSFKKIAYNGTEVTSKNTEV